MQTSAPATHPLQFKILALPERTALGGGIPPFLMRMPGTGLVRLDCTFPAGKDAETVPLQARFTASQMREATKSFPAAVIDEHIDSLGAQVSVRSRMDYTDFSILGLRDTLPQLVAFLHSVLTEPLFDETRFRLAVQQSLEEWRIGRQKVETVAQELFLRKLYAFHPSLGRIAGEEDYRNLTTEQLRDYHRRVFDLRQATLLLTGDFDDSAVGLLDQTFGAYRHDGVPAKAPAPALPTPHGDAAPSCIDMPRKTLQSAIRMGRLLPPPTHPDFPLIRLANIILGGYFGSRLMTNIREERGYTYDIFSRLRRHDGWSELLVSTETPYANVADTIRQVEIEMRRLGQEPVPEAELRNVKRYIAGKDSREYEPSFRFPNRMVGLMAAHCSLDDIRREAEAMSRASQADIRRVAAQYLNPADCVCCVAGK